MEIGDYQGPLKWFSPDDLYVGSVYGGLAEFTKQPLPTGLLQPVGESQWRGATNVGQGVSGWFLDRVQPYVEQ